MKEIKYSTVEEALNLIEDNDYIVCGLSAAEPKLILEKIHTIYDRINKITIANCLPLLNAEYLSNAKYADKIFIDAWFYTKDLRMAHEHGNISYVPNHLHVCSAKKIYHAHPNVYMGIASMPDEHGYVSLSLSNTYEKRIIEQADKIILEVNENAPRTFGDVELHISDITCMVKANYEMTVFPDVPISEKDYKIGKYISQYINDGDCIQLGIGGIPNAVTEFLKDKKDLGVHTEMLTSGMVKLAKSGVINNSKKNIYKGKMVAAFALGTKELYDYINNNPSVMILDGRYVNDPDVIKQNDNQKSINTTIEIDLTGQCCSESMGCRQFSGSGGQADTAIGAQKSKGGMSFIALYSTAMARNPITNEKEEVSKIVSTLKEGAGVTLSRNDVDFVVTEYGIVQLRGTSIRERVESLVSIAHPKFREQLMREAKEKGII